MTVLAVDDDASQLELLRTVCGSLEYPKIDYVTATSIAEALSAIARSVIDLVITDLRMPEGSGLDLLRTVRRQNPFLPVVVMTAHEDAREAVSLLKEGADDYLVKPTRPSEIKRLILRVNERGILQREAFLPPLEGGPAVEPAMSGIVYRSEAMARVMNLAARCADSHATVLVSGESGTGKELVARFIHDRGSRRDRNFVAVNISALPESLAESELFGHRRGAYTGADEDRVGRFEEADQGTLFLDEIGDVSAVLQVKLLRAIQFGVIERVGENQPRKLDTRIVAATNHNLAALVAEGRFRKDLFYRVNVIGIQIPPLRERKEDIKILIDFFIQRFNERNGRAVRGLSREAFERLMRHDFPGNVRELENLMEHAVVMCRGEHILEGDLPAFGENGDDAIQSGGIPASYEDAMLRFERELLQGALVAAGGNQSKAARSLGITERHMRSRLFRIGMK